MKKEKSIKNKLLNSRFWILDSRRVGQTLIETLVAVSVLTAGFLGIVTLLSRSLGLNRVVSDNYTASYLAAEGAEVIKNILDSNSIGGNEWLRGINSGDFEVVYNGDISGLRPYTGKKLEFDADRNLFAYSGGEETAFTRKITIDISHTDEVQVNSRVDWITRGGGALFIDAEDHFFNWKKYADGE